MAKNRDDFTRNTTDILAKRVGYLCSNPKCRRSTIGSNENPEKATILGIASHITAASKNGPRFDKNLSQAERKNIDNAIWLCALCASSIDKNSKSFPVSLLKEWKATAEKAASVRLFQEHEVNSSPFIEADLIWSSFGRWAQDYSPKTSEVFAYGSNLPVYYWKLTWSFSITIYNTKSRAS